MGADSARALKAGKIIYAGFGRWRAPEQQAVREVFRAAFEQAITEHPDHTDAEDWLCARLRLGADLDEALGMWSAAPQRNATLQLAGSLQSASLGSADAPPFWDELPVPHRATFDAWLRRPAARASLEAALPNAGDDEWLIREALTVTSLQ